MPLALSQGMLSAWAENFPNHQVLIPLYLTSHSSIYLFPPTKQQGEIRLYLLYLALKFPQAKYPS